MRIAIPLAAAAAVALVLTHAPDTAEACSCRPPPPAKESFEEAAAVFIGVPQAMEQAGGIRMRVPMQVQRAYKGVDQARVELATARDSASCGYPFEIGRPYLVYAYADQETGLSVSLCSRTRPLEDAQDDVQAIEQITPGTVPDGGQAQAPTDKPRPPRADVAGVNDPQPTPPAAGPPPQQVEPGSRGCGCRGAAGGTEAGLLAGLVGLALLARRRRQHG